MRKYFSPLELILATLITLLIFVFLCICFNIDVQATSIEKILYPDSAGIDQNWIPKGGGTHFPEVDEACGSGDTGTYVYKHTSDVLDYCELFRLQNCNYGADTIPDFVVIDSIVEHIGLKKDAGTVIVTAKWRDSTTSAEYWYDPAGEFILTTSYVEYHSVRTTNLDGGILTKANVNALQIGGTLAMDEFEDPGIAFMSWVHIHVYYREVAKRFLMRGGG